MPIEFGWMLPYGKSRQPSDETALARILRLIEPVQEAFHGLWLPDHLFMEDADTLECMTTLSFLAGRFPDLHVGSIVIGQSYRNPALLAKMAATLQTLSGGRFVLGLGAGWKEDEYRAYGYPFPSTAVRIAQMAEVARICRLMWDPARSAVTFHGRHYHIDDAVCLPKPAPPPPILIGGGGEKLTLRVVAELADWWNLPGASPAVFAHKLQVLQRHCTRIGRDAGAIRKTWKGVVSIAPTRELAQAQMEGFSMWPGDEPLLGTPEDVRAQLQAYVDLGVSYFILTFVNETSPADIQLFVRKVIPFFRRV